MNTSSSYFQEKLGEFTERLKILKSKYPVIYLCKKKKQTHETAQDLEWIISKGANIHERSDGEGLQGIHWVCHNDGIGCLNVLIKHGADINSRAGIRAQYFRQAQQDRAKWTPLEYALHCNSDRCTRRLIDAGCQLWSHPHWPRDWMVEYVENRKFLRCAAKVILVSKKRKCSFQVQDVNIVRMIAKMVWGLRNEI